MRECIDLYEIVCYNKCIRGWAKDMNDFDKIAKEIQLINNTYIATLLRTIAVHNEENRTRDDYKGCQIYELMQVAVVYVLLYPLDALPESPSAKMSAEEIEPPFTRKVAL